MMYVGLKKLTLFFFLVSKEKMTDAASLVIKRRAFAKTFKEFVSPSSEGFVEFQVDRFNRRFKLEPENAFTAAITKRASQNVFIGTHATGKALKTAYLSLLSSCSGKACSHASLHQKMVECQACHYVRYCSPRCASDSKSEHAAVCVGTHDFGVRQNLERITHEFMDWCSCFGKNDRGERVLGPVIDPDLGCCIRWMFPMPLVRRVDTAGETLKMQEELDALLVLSQMANGSSPAGNDSAFGGSFSSSSHSGKRGEFAFTSKPALNNELAMTIMRHWGGSCTAMDRQGFVTEDGAHVACMLCGSALNFPAILIDSKENIDKKMAAIDDSELKATTDAIKNLSVTFGGIVMGLNNASVLDGLIYCVCSIECARIYQPLVMPHIRFGLAPHPSNGSVEVRTTAVLGVGLFDMR